jgi:hypothetical protein
MKTLGIVALAAIAAAPAGAQRQQKSDVSPKETRLMMHDYAKCVVARQRPKASEALLANVDNATLLRRYPSLIVGQCLKGPRFATTRMSFAGDLYRYALADALVNREFALAPAPNFAEIAPLVHREAEPKPDPAKLRGVDYDAALTRHGESGAFRFLSVYGECIVRADSANSKALLTTQPESVGEAARFTALQPAFARCMPEGNTVRFGKVALRGSIAVNYYRLAHAAAGTPVKART